MLHIVVQIVDLFWDKNASNTYREENQGERFDIALSEAQVIVCDLIGSMALQIS